MRVSPHPNPNPNPNLTPTPTLNPDPNPNPNPNPDPHPNLKSSPGQARRVTRARPAGAWPRCASSPRPPPRAAPPGQPPVRPRRAWVRVGLVVPPRGGGAGEVIPRPAARGGRTSPSRSCTGRTHGVSGAAALTCALALAFARNPNTRARTPTLTLAPTEPSPTLTHPNQP